MRLNSPDHSSHAAAGDLSAALHRLIRDLYPICRSITGDGVRQTLDILSRQIPLQVYEVPSGTRVFDWTVPKEWNIRDAYVKDAKGERIIDFKKSNLHVVGYSLPVKAKMRLADLKPHLHTLPEQPEWIPQRNSYFYETWGFCLSHRQFLALKDEEYEVCIDSSLRDGHLTYGECLLHGKTADEVLISCHVCHPSLCNDNLSGISLATHLAKHLGGQTLRYSYRFLFIPCTIGSITWLARNEAHVGRIKHGLVVSCVGDGGQSTYKKSRRGDAEVDQAAAHVLKHSGDTYAIVDFSPDGYDERQYCSPGFNLPVGCLMRTPNGRFPEYHTSADNLEFVKAPALADSFVKAVSILSVIENNRTYRNQSPKGEPQLDRRGLHHTMGDTSKRAGHDMALLWVLNLSDGTRSLLDIAERSGLEFDVISSAADALVERSLLEECVPPS